MRHCRWIGVAIWVGAAVALVLGFAAYQRPEVAVDLANRLWACF